MVDDDEIAEFLRPLIREAVKRYNASWKKIEEDIEASKTDPFYEDDKDIDKLTSDFAKALADKLKGANRKYGYRQSYKDPDWQHTCRSELIRHLAKGDPLDVAAYCAFMWYHGWSTI